MPGTLDLNNYFLNEQPRRLRDSSVKTIWDQERSRRSEQANQPPLRKAEEFALQNPQTLTGRIISKAVGVPYEERVARIGGAQYQGATATKRRMRRALRRLEA